MTSLSPQTFIPGYRLQSGTDLNTALANPQWSTTSNLTATTGGTVGTSVKIVATITNISSAAVNAGVVIPRAAIGKFLQIINSSANPVKVFAEGGATIDGVAGATGYVLAGGSSVNLYGVDTTAWKTSSSAGGAVAGGFVNIEDFGAVGDAKAINDLGGTTGAVSVVAGSNVVNVTNANFALTDEGKTISINGAGPAQASGYPKIEYSPVQVGNGYISSADTLATKGQVITLAGAKRGIYKVECTAVSPSIEFTVYDPSGVQVGSPFIVQPSPNAGTLFSNEIQFYIRSGTTPFAITDAFDVLVLWTPLIATISQYVSPTQIVVSGAASQTLTAASELVIWGTNNTAAIQSAIASTASAVYVPAGNFLITSRLVLDSGQTIFGDGFNSNIWQITPNRTVVKAGDSSTVRNLRLSLVDGINVRGEDSSFAAGVVVRSVNNVTVENNWISGGDYGVCGVLVLTTKNTKIKGNILYGNKWTDRAGGDNAGAEQAGDILVYGGTRNTIIDGNYCLSNNRTAISIPNPTDVDWIISNNVCVTLDTTTCYPGGPWDEAANGGNRSFVIVCTYGRNTQEGPRAVVNANVVRNAGLVGIYRTADADNTGPIIISNNMVSNIGYDVTSSISGGINVHQAGRDIITGNSVIDYKNYVSGSAIFINSIFLSENPIKVSNNFVKGSLKYGLGAQGRVKNIIIENNTFVENSDTDVYVVPTAGITTIGGHTVTGNTIKRQGATFTGRIDNGTPGNAGTVLTVDSGLVGTIAVGQLVFGTGVTTSPLTYIVARVSATVWTVNQSQNVASTSTMSSGLSPAILYSPQSSTLVTTFARNTISGSNNTLDVTSSYNSGIWITGKVDFSVVTDNDISGFYYGINYFAYQTTFRNAEISYNYINNCFSGIYIGTLSSPSSFTVPLVGNTFNNLNSAGAEVANKVNQVGWQCLRLGPTLIVNNAALPTAGSWIAGDKVFYTAPTPSADWGVVCTTTGQFGTLTGITADTTNGSATITVSSSASLSPTMAITIAGVTGSKIIRSVSGTTVVLTSTCDATVTAGAVAYVAPVFKSLGTVAP